jgi:hypothetical protein
MKFHRRLPLLLAAFFLAAAVAAIAADELAWPPITAQTKPWAFNWWMGSAVDKTNLTKELQRYHDAGLGGIHIIPIYGAKGFESKYLNYLSPEWMEMMGWAVSEAHRLGMGVDMTTGTGWCFGGPQVTDNDANASVVVKTYVIVSGQKVNGKFSRDATQALVAFSSDGKSVELTDKISASGELDWTVPNDSTNWTIYAISQKPSGQKVKRAAPGGEGWMLNLIYPPAMDDFLKPYTAAFASYHGPKPRAQFVDSYEYRSDWSPNFFAEFEKRRGYKLQTELPALFSKNPDDHRARVLCDYRQTVSEIMAEESMPAWTKWAHAEGFITRYQAHGSPGNLLDLYATADIPETEMFHLDRNKLVSKFASSAAHVAGHPLVSSETGTWLEEHFTEKLSDVKYLFDDMFLSGINHMFYHGCCYSPDEAGWPGWHFYASTEMNPRNPIWRDADALNAYAARVQSILQSGQPDNDILLYWPIEDYWMQPGDKLLPQFTVSNTRDWFTSQPIGDTAKALWDRGYAFDYVSDAQLKTAKAENGLIHLPHSREYSVVLVPKCTYMPLETFKQLLSLAQNGARVVFEDQLPEDISGLVSAEKHEEFKRLSAQLSFRTGASIGLRDCAVVRFGNNGYFVKGNLVPALLFNAVGPQSALAFSGLNFICSEEISKSRWNYFVVNKTGTNFDGWVRFYVNEKSAVLLDPMTGNTGVAATRKMKFAPDLKFVPDWTEYHLQLHVGESIIVRIFRYMKAEDSTWNYWQTNGQSFQVEVPFHDFTHGRPDHSTLPIVGGGWKVKFLDGGPVLPADYSTTKLTSWTTFPDTNCQAFAGTAKYEVAFQSPIRIDPQTGLPLELDVTREKFFLDLGDVRQSARVRVNGKDYGTLITPPFRVVVDNLKPAGNTLEVEVTSVAANRIRDLDRRGVKWKTFRDINFVDINYKPFDASNWPLTDCGLLGPVTLTAASR